MIRRVDRPVPALLLGCALGQPAAAGVVVGMVRTDLTSGVESPADRFYVQDEMLKIEPGSATEAYGLIFRDDSLYLVDHGARTYQHVTGEQIRETAKQLGPLLEQMRERLDGLPAEQRAQMEQMMQERMGFSAFDPPEVEMLDTGRDDRVDELDCRLWEMRIDGARVHEICVAAADKVTGGAELAAALRDIARFQQGALDALGMAAAADNPLMSLTTLRGVPVQTVTYEQDRAVERVRLRDAEQRQLDAADFLPPKDYRQVENPP